MYSTVGYGEMNFGHRLKTPVCIGTVPKAEIDDIEIKASLLTFELAIGQTAQGVNQIFALVFTLVI